MAGIGTGEGAEGGVRQVFDVDEAAVLPEWGPLEFRFLGACLFDMLDVFFGPDRRRAEADSGYAGALGEESAGMLRQVFGGAVGAAGAAGVSFVDGEEVRFVFTLEEAHGVDAAVVDYAANLMFLGRLKHVPGADYPAGQF